MKNTMKLLTVVVALGVSLLVGCVTATTPESTKVKVLKICRTAAYTASMEVLLSKPEVRDTLILAQDNLKILAASPLLDLEVLLAVVDQIPFSKQIHVMVNAALMIVDALLPDASIGENKFQVASTGFVEGIDMALAEVPVIVDESKAKLARTTKATWRTIRPNAKGGLGPLKK